MAESTTGSDEGMELHQPAVDVAVPKLNLNFPKQTFVNANPAEVRADVTQSVALAVVPRTSGNTESSVGTTTSRRLSGSKDVSNQETKAAGSASTPRGQSKRSETAERALEASAPLSDRLFRYEMTAHKEGGVLGHARTLGQPAAN